MQSKTLESRSICHTIRDHQEIPFMPVFCGCSLQSSHKNRTDTRGQQSAAVLAGLGESLIHSQKLNIALKHTLAEDYYCIAMRQFDSLTFVTLGCRAQHSQVSFKAIHLLNGCS